MTVDFDPMSYEELEALVRDASAELERRRILADAPRQADKIAEQVVRAEGIKRGDPWEPRNTLGYPFNWVTTHNGKTWRSLHPINVWEPGVAGWREETADGSPPPYRQPVGAVDAYQAGEQITWTDGRVYRAVRNGVAHSPAEYARDWELVSAPPEPEPEPGPPIDPDNPPSQPEPVDPSAPEPEPEPEPADAEWIPDGHRYTTGDVFVYQGTRYRVRQDHTSMGHYTPPIVPALYEVIP